MNNLVSFPNQLESSYSIARISDKKARNIIRGLLNNENKSDFTNSLKKISANSNNKTFKECLHVIRGNELFRNNSFSRYFPDKCMVIQDSDILATEDEIIDVLNINIEKINEILKIYSEAYKKIFTSDFYGFIRIAEDLVKKQGFSLLLVRLIHYVKSKLIQHDDAPYNLKTKIDSLFDLIQSAKSKKLDNAIKWILASNDEYFNYYSKIKENNNNNYVDLIVKNLLDSYPKDAFNYDTTLNAYYSISLIDSLIYILNSERINLPFTLKFSEKFIESRGIYDSFTKNFPTLMIKGDTKDEYIDLRFFKESFLLNELNWVFEYRVVHEAFYVKNEVSYLSRVPLQNKLIKKYFNCVNNFSDLRCHDIQKHHVNFNEYNVENCGQLENTTALMYLIEKKDGDILGNDHSFVKLMTFTHDIGIICSDDLLQKIHNSCSSTDASLIISCLMLIKYKTRAAEHVLRANLQELLLERFESNFINLVIHFHNISPAVTEHFINICDENFLSKLFDITERPIDAINNRADILEWYGTVTKDQLYIERSKNLRTDIKISKEKGTIDDSRIYVDTNRYIQWLNDNKLNELLNLLEGLNVSTSLDVSNIKVNWSIAKSGLSVIDCLAAELIKSYEEFCENKLFGVTSYLGRRIRHGTFKGTGLKDINDIQTSYKYTNLRSNKTFNEYYSNWIENYSQMLEDLKNNHLHIYSKFKPKGFIHTEISSKSKQIIADHLLRDIINSYLKDNTGVSLPYIIVEYSWRFIEEDLSDLRKLLMELKSKFGVFNMLGHNFQGALKREYHEYATNINSVAAEKFRTISSWFNKPSIVSPTTDIVLLFKAVVSEVKGLLNGFEPSVKVCEEKYEISGGKYFAIYDALYIIIHNAAKHGKLDGSLELDIKFNSESKALKISVISDFNNSTCKENQLFEINSVFNENNENANIIEGRSGIKKLTRMESDQYISNLSYNHEELKLCFSFDFLMDY